MKGELLQLDCVLVSYVCFVCTVMHALALQHSQKAPLCLVTLRFCFSQHASPLRKLLHGLQHARSWICLLIAAVP